jgi:hypothetical protein
VLGLVGVVAIALIKDRDLRETVHASGERPVEAPAKP